METPAGPSPTPDEARESLRQLAEDQDAVRYPPIPYWFFVVMAAAIAGLHLVQLLPDSDAGRMTQLVGIVAIAAGAGGLGHRYWLNRDGVSWVTPRLADMVPFLLGTSGTYLLCLALDETTGARWVFLVGAAVAASVVLVTGYRYVKIYGDGR
ncbi:hypothetical protein [Blastococcus sp. LR1]|uniref:hypothetical protein n=1 Tax=Blastococcus sp. LR1 TaxID=2877000 RepID=UPI001CCDBE9E|nr:hypothetical protein [Blastococcus sp. LR1]MCA0144157.1 hypothetical protein [Blastococcus sp. LR1]